MMAADGERPAARMHPMVDVRSAAQLLQRAGWSDPVVDSRTLKVSYRSLDKLVSDLRDQGLGSVLASPAPPLTRKGLERARSAFLEGAGMTVRGELARVAALSRPDAGKGNRALVAAGVAAMLSDGVYRRADLATD